MNVCLYVCMYVWNLYKFTFLNRSEPDFARLSIGLEETVGYGPEILDLFDILGPFSLGWGPLQNHGHKIASGATVFRGTLISVIPAGVCVTSPT